MAVITVRPVVLATVLAFLATAAAAQDSPSKPGKPAQNGPDAPAKALFGAKARPVDMAARSIGFYTRGCIAGAVALPIDGPYWQAMRLSRNRNWGHPELIRMLERLAKQGPKLGWPGLLVGDLAQPRGGPMLSGHASHQVGLDADVWLTPMPARVLSRQEREEMSATNVVAADWNDIDPAVWTPQHLAIIRAAALAPEVERVLVNPAIKKALCREAQGNRAWLSKVRPYYGHNYHMHIRIHCPKGDPCKPQPPPPNGDGCDKSLAWWFSDAARKPPTTPKKPRPPLRLADLPAACRAVLTAP
ncbi:MAG: penicillin-insensitive murein endopeptidase [Rhizobiales bacterium]|nr:penicillin-insensitive murein endopeptidase [Hyphomicrobiales bacterium]